MGNNVFDNSVNSTVSAAYTPDNIQVLEGLETCTGKTYPQINILGGGTKDNLGGNR